MADLGNLFFKMHIEDMSDTELEKLIQNVQNKLENSKVKLGVDFDQRAVDEVVGKIRDVKKRAAQSPKGKKEKILSFDKQAATAEAEAVVQTYEDMFDKIDSKRAYYMSKQHRVKADSERFADTYYKKIRKESRMLGRELDALYVDRKAGLIGGDKTEGAIDLLKKRMVELYKAEQSFKKDGSFDRGLWEKLKDGDFKDSVKQAKQMVSAEKKLNMKKRRDAEIDAQIDAEIERERKQLVEADLAELDKRAMAIQKQHVQKQKALDYGQKQEEKQAEKDKRTDAKIEAQLEKEESTAHKNHLAELNKQAMAIQKQQVQKQKAAELDAEIDRKIDKEYLKDAADADKNREKIDKDKLKQLERDIEYYSEVQAKKQKAAELDAEIDRKIDKEYLEDAADADKKRKKIDKDRLKEIERDAYIISDIQAKKQKALDYEQKQKKKQSDKDERDALSKKRKEVNEKVRILSEIQKFENEISRLRIQKRFAGEEDEGLRKAIKHLEKYKQSLKDALEYNSTKGAIRGIKDGTYRNALNQSKRIIQLERAANKEREKAGKLIAAQNREIERANGSFKSQYRLLWQLGSQIGNLYSIYGLERFLTSMIEIGGEFQKQRIALRAMLNDTAKADVMFGKIKELAIDSPYNFRDLMGYTKQVAAFGIPYEEMYDTTKRLADISAGLGVDMGRIILAFGQVRSAAVLRGQELRQFTEAGIPMVEELAMKFSELEGRVVSVGDVFEKISNREVSFDMVKDILWKMTNEGGKFYNMQETLTESVSGKLAKLKDAWELMLGEIAEGNSGVIGGTLDLLTSLTEKWEKALQLILSLASAYGVYKGAMMVATVAKAAEIALTAAQNKQDIVKILNMRRHGQVMTKTTASAIRLFKALRNFSLLGKGGTIGLIVGAIAGLATYLFTASDAADELKEKLQEIADETEKETNGAIGGFYLLVNKLDEVKKKYGETAEQTNEYAEIIRQMNASYGQYMNRLYSESEAYDAVKNSVEGVTAAIKEKKNTERYERSASTIEEDYSELLSDAKNNLQKRIKTAYKINDAEAKDFVNEIVRRIDTYPDLTLDEITQDVAKIFNRPYAVLYSKIVDGKRVDINALGAPLKRYASLNKEKNEALKNLLDDFESIPLKSFLDEIDKKYEPLFKKAENNEDAKRDLNLKKKREYLSLYESKGLGKTDFASKLRIEIAELERFGDDWVKITKKVRDEVYEDNKKVDGKVVEQFLNTVLPTPEEIKKGTLHTYLDRLSGVWKPINESLDTMKKRENDAYTEADRTEIARLEDQKLYIEKFLQQLGLSTSIFDKDKKGKGGSEKDPVIESLTERLKLLKDAHTEYKRFSETEGHIKAMERVKGSGIFDMLFNGNEPVNLDDYYNEVDKIKKAIENRIKEVGSTEDSRNAHEEASRIVLGIDLELERSSLEERLQAIQNYINEMIVNWDIFKSIRDKTGNTELAELIAFKLNFGENDLMNSIRNEANKNLEGREETFDEILPWSDEMLKKEGLAILVPFVNAYRDAQSNLRKSTADTFAKLITDNKNYAAQIKEIERKKNADILNFENKRKQFEDTGVDVDGLIEQRKKLADQEVGKVRFEEFKESEEWVKIFDDLGRVSTASLDSMIEKVEYFAKSQRLSVEDTKELIEALRKLRDESLSRNPWKSLSSSFTELKEVSSRIKHLKKLYKKNKTEKNKQNINSAKDEQYEKRLEATKALHAATNDMREVLNAGDQVLGIMKQFGFEAPEWLTGYMNGMGEVVSGLEHIDLTKPMTIVTGTLQSLKGAIGAITSIGGIIDWNGSNAKEVNELTVRLTDSNERLIKSVDALKDEMSKSGGWRAIDAAKQAKKDQSQIQSQTADILRAQMGYHGSHHSNAYYWRLSKKDYDSINKSLADYAKKNNKKASSVFSLDDILGLSPEEMDYIRTHNIEMWKLMLDQGKYDKSEFWNQFADLAGQMEEIEESLRETLTQTSFNGLRDSFISSLMDMNKSAKDFSNDFSNYMMKAMLNSRISDLLDDDLKEFYKKWSDYSESENKLSDTELDELRRKWEELTNKGLQIRDDIAGITGYDGSNGSQGGLSKGVEGITESTADLLASYINAIRADVSVMRTFKEKFFGEDFPQLNALAQAQLTQLNTIAVNTGRNVELVNEIYSLLKGNIKGTNKFHI